MARKRVVNLSWYELEGLCALMSQRVEELYGTPALVVGISRPGYEVARRVAACRRGVAVVMAQSQRSTTALKRTPIINALLRRLPRRMADMLRIAESKLGRKRQTPRRVVIPPVELQIRRGATVLIVDDAADSGATLAGAISAASERWPEARIITATIATTRRRLLVEPDVSALPCGTLVRFPWAVDSHE